MNQNRSDEEILAAISPSAPRRMLGISVLAGLGGLLLYLGLASPPGSLFWQLFLLGLGGLSLFLAEALRRATRHRIELTATELRESSGRLLARVGDIERIDRGAFAVKPSNGFLLVLAQPLAAGNHWAPGLWWRVGRRVGVGGITSAPEAKALAEMLTAMVVHGHRFDD